MRGWVPGLRLILVRRGRDAEYTKKHSLVWHHDGSMGRSRRDAEGEESEALSEEEVGDGRQYMQSRRRRREPLPQAKKTQ